MTQRFLPIVVGRLDDVIVSMVGGAVMGCWETWQSYCPRESSIITRDGIPAGIGYAWASHDQKDGGRDRRRRGPHVDRSQGRGPADRLLRSGTGEAAEGECSVREGVSGCDSCRRGLR